MASKQEVSIDEQFELFWADECGENSLSSLSPSVISASKRWAKKCFNQGFIISMSEIERLREEIKALENEYTESLDVQTKLLERLVALVSALKEIAKGEGRFSRDQLTHADNCIDDMKAIAIKAVEDIQANTTANKIK